MKKLTIIIGLLVAAQIVFSQDKVDLTLEVEGILDNTGLLKVNVFNSKDTYLKESVQSVSFDLEAAEGSQFVLEGLPKGEYAVSVVHDENKNGQLDFGAMGPVEGYGFSNNPPATFGPASYEDAKLEVEEDMVLTIKLN